MVFGDFFCTWHMAGVSFTHVRGIVVGDKSGLAQLQVNDRETSANNAKTLRMDTNSYLGINSGGKRLNYVIAG